MFAEGKRGIGMNGKSVGDVDVEASQHILFRRQLLLGAWTPGHNVLMASLVDYAGAYLALIALRSNQSPNELAAVRAKCWLFEPRCHKLVTADLMDASTHGT